MRPIRWSGPWVRRSLLVVLVVVGSGCIADPDDARMDVPGDFLGSYAVEASLEESTCGAGSLSAPGLWDFAVQLSRDENHLYWSNGAQSIRGDLSTDGTKFGFTSQVSTTLKEAKPGRPGCVIWRQDAASGVLELGADPKDVPSFQGTLVYSYAQGTDSQCGDVLKANGVTKVPCEIRYGMNGRRADE